MPFRPGQVIARRYHKRHLVTWVQATVVAADDPNGLLLWQPVGAPLVLYRDPTGRGLHDAPIDELVGASHLHTTWRHHNALILHPPAADYSVWWLFTGPRFAGWYVNLEAAYVRRSTAIDTTDHALDIEVDPQRNVTWKDEAEFHARTGHPWYWDAAEAARIRATAQRVARAAASGKYPFDGTHCDFRPDPAWPLPELPERWDDAPAGIP
jgi:hypothetical protein